MEKISVWSDLELIGEKLGYPIYLFRDGYCAKSMECENQTAIAVVRKLPRSGKLQIFTVASDFPQTQFEVLAVSSFSEECDDAWNFQKALLQVLNGCKLDDSRLARVFLTEGKNADVQKYVREYPYLAANEIACFLRNPNLRDKVVKDWLLWLAKHINPSENNDEQGTYLEVHTLRIVSSLKLDLMTWFLKTFLKDLYRIEIASELNKTLLKRCFEADRVDVVNVYLAELVKINGTYGFGGQETLEFLWTEVAHYPRFAIWYANEYLPKTTRDA